MIVQNDRDESNTVIIDQNYNQRYFIIGKIILFSIGISYVTNSVNYKTSLPKPYHYFTTCIFRVAETGYYGICGLTKEVLFDNVMWQKGVISLYQINYSGPTLSSNQSITVYGNYFVN